MWQRFVHCSIGDKPHGSAVESRDPSGKPVIPCRKKKLASSRRSYDKPSSENKHLHLKPFHSDPTDSSSCGHLALAKKMSDEYKCKPMHIPEHSKSTTSKAAGDCECRPSEDKPSIKDDDAACSTENLHQRLRRQMAIQGSNDPRAATLAKTYNVNYSSEHSCGNADVASSEVSADLPTSVPDDVSSFGSRNSCRDVASRNRTQLDTDWSLSRINPLNETKQEFSQRPLRSDSQPYVAVGVGDSCQDRMSEGRLPSAFLASANSRTDQMCFVPPVVYDVTDLHSNRQFPAPQFLPRLYLSPSWPQQRFVYQSQSYLRHNEQMRPSVASIHRFLHR